MPHILFYQINGHMIDIDNFAQEEKLIISTVFLNELSHLDILDHNSLEKILNRAIDSGKYLFIDHKDYIYFRKLSVIEYLQCRLGLFRFKDNYDSLIATKVLTFRHTMKERLINELTSPDSTIEDRLKSLADYTFSPHYSLWIYNKELDCFTCSVSSFTELGLIINNHDNCSLRESLKFKEGSMESRAICNDSPFDDELTRLDLRYVNRLCINYGDRGLAIASFYSNLDSFEFNDKLFERLSQSLKSKLTEELEKSHEKFEEFTQLVKIDLINYKYPEYATKFLQTICDHFKYEYSALYYVEDGELIKLTSFGDVADFSEAQKEISEALTNELRSYVFTPSEALVHNPKSDKQKEKPIKSAIVNPFMIQDDCLCLIAANKLGIDKKPVCLPSPVDLDILERVAETLIFSTGVYITYEKLGKELEKRDNFSKVWRHEIRTPINKFTLSPDIIKILLKDLSIDDELQRKIEDQLDDIKMFGSRLKQLTDTYNFKEILKSKIIKRLSALRDIIYPISMLTKEYARKQFNLSLDVDHDSFRNIYVESDKKLLNMVLNALVDNAIKYSKDDSTFIFISGETLNSEMFVIKVSNKGTPIFEEDMTKIFEEGERGMNAKSQKIDGTGIGLYIADTVMNSLGGDLVISSNNDEKIEFSMMIPFKDGSHD